MKGHNMEHTRIQNIAPCTTQAVRKRHSVRDLEFWKQYIPHFIQMLYLIFQVTQKTSNFDCRECPTAVSACAFCCLDIWAIWPTYLIVIKAAMWMGCSFWQARIGKFYNTSLGFLQEGHTFFQRTPHYLKNCPSYAIKLYWRQSIC